MREITDTALAPAYPAAQELAILNPKPDFGVLFLEICARYGDSLNINLEHQDRIESVNRHRLIHTNRRVLGYFLNPQNAKYLHIECDPPLPPPRKRPHKEVSQSHLSHTYFVRLSLEEFRGLGVNHLGPRSH